MAQFVTGTATGPGAGDAFFLAIRTQVLANSWTELDVISTSTGTRDVVFQGAALDSTANNKPIVRLTQLNSTTMALRSYTDWDTSAHAGWLDTGPATAAINIQDASFVYWMKINGFAWSLCYKIGANYNKNYAGFFRRSVQTSKSGITKASGSISAGLTAGTTVAVASDMTTKLKAGQYVHILNYGHSNASANKTHIERIQIQAVTSTTISFQTNVVNAYDAGALIGFNPMPNVSMLDTNSVSTFGTVYAPYYLDATRTSATGQTISTVANLPNTFSAENPDSASNEYLAGYFQMTENVGGHQCIRGIPYHFEIVAGGTQGAEDIMDDGDHQWQLFNVSASSVIFMMGPKDL